MNEQIIVPALQLDSPERMLTELTFQQAKAVLTKALRKHPYLDLRLAELKLPRTCSPARTAERLLNYFISGRCNKAQAQCLYSLINIYMED